jgi:hypothetical protein
MTIDPHNERKPPRNPKKSGFLRKMTLLFGLPILLLALMLVVLSGSDQVRPLTVSDNAFEPLLKGNESERIKQLAHHSDQEEKEAILEEIARRNCPLPDISTWPTEQQAQASQYQAEECELLVKYLTLPERTRGLSYDDAYAQLKQLGDKENAISRKYKELINHCSVSERQAMYKRHQAFWRPAYTGLYVVRGEWITAAKVNIDDWDKATYYLRRDGAKGRIVLAIWSSMRRVWPERFK